MSRYIDADALKEEFTCNCDEWICNIIDNEPTIDAVSVVRCKECKRANHELSGIYCGLSDVNMGEDGYCSIGEREGE